MRCPALGTCPLASESRCCCRHQCCSARGSLTGPPKPAWPQPSTPHRMPGRPLQWTPNSHTLCRYLFELLQPRQKGLFVSDSESLCFVQRLSQVVFEVVPTILYTILCKLEHHTYRYSMQHQCRCSIWMSDTLNWAGIGVPSLIKSCHTMQSCDQFAMLKLHATTRPLPEGDWATGQRCLHSSMLVQCF